MCSQLCEWSRQRNVEGFRVDSWFGRMILNKLKYLRDSHESETAVGAVEMQMISGRTKDTVVELWLPSQAVPLETALTYFCFRTSPTCCSEHARYSTLLMTLRRDS